MNIYEALDHMRQGKIARCKHSYFAIDNGGFLVRINKDCTVRGIANGLSGDIFATDNWELLEQYPVIKENRYGFYHCEI